MKNFAKKIAVFCGIIAIISSVVGFVSPGEAYAEECRAYFLGLPSWDCNVGDIKNEEDLKNSIGMIAANVLTAISAAAAYLVVGYVIYGGYLYMMSSGDPGKAAAAKNTLVHAFIGLAIVICAYAIFSGIRIALVGNQAIGSCDPTTGDGCIKSGETGQMILNLIQWVAGMGGAVAAIFLVVGGWGYMTSAGDPGKVQKAKNTILYAIIGLIVVALAEVITAFIGNTIRESAGINYRQDSLISTNINKENPNEKS